MSIFSESSKAVRIAVHFSASNPFEGSLCIQGHAEHECAISLIHQRMGDAQHYDFNGDDRYIGLDFVDGDALMIVARRSGTVVASAIFEICMSLVTDGLLLVPRALSNLIAEQHHVTAQPSSRESIAASVILEKAVRTW